MSFEERLSSSPRLQFMTLMYVLCKEVYCISLVPILELCIWWTSWFRVAYIHHRVDITEPGHLSTKKSKKLHRLRTQTCCQQTWLKYIYLTSQWCRRRLTCQPPVICCEDDSLWWTCSLNTWSIFAPEVLICAWLTNVLPCYWKVLKSTIALCEHRHS